ncbi:Universal stress protein family protein [Caballeronia fortuita]|uniref:Universal stress protein family protein n=1 Tax=Caballeronia fortuita TaxID=1777138 RepID=A0A158BF65_9BURK|nr:universal stress protein [Caballeronia fortuita]SAK68673.1 Universal stress protein family protein [Caballeronia fortuita]
MQQHILVAVGPDGSHAALALGIARARECNARLTALHVVDRAPFWAVSSAQYDFGAALAHVDELAREVEKRTLQAIRASSINGVCVTMDLPCGTTLARVIAQAAREFDANLIVIGRARSTHWRFWEERVADAVSHYSNRRVLIASNRADSMDHAAGFEARFEAGVETKATPLRFTIVDSTQRTTTSPYSSRGSSPCRIASSNRPDAPC